MIWRKGIPENVKNNFLFAATWLSVFEIFKTKEKNPGIIIKTWERIRDNSVYIMPLLPAQHLDSYLSLGKTVSNKYFELQKAEVGAFNNVLMRKKFNTLHNDDWDKFLNTIDNNRASYIADFNLWVKRINDFKKENKLVERKNNHDEKEETLNFKKNFLTTQDGVQYYWEEVTMPILKTFLSDDYEPSLTEFSQCELFINVFNQYMIDVEIGACTPTVNDLIDIFNMIYVTPIDKYWTEEKKWINIINDLSLTKYLFDPIAYKEL